jgi:hypothetical protein
MDEAKALELIAKVDEKIKKAEVQIGAQKERIRTWIAYGYPTVEAEETLESLKHSVQVLLGTREQFQRLSQQRAQLEKESSR